MIPGEVMFQRVEVSWLGGAAGMGLPVPAARVFGDVVRAALPERSAVSLDFGCGAARCWLEAEAPAGAPLVLPHLRRPDPMDLALAWNRARASVDRDEVHEAALAAVRAGGLPGRADFSSAWAAFRAMPRQVVVVGRHARSRFPPRPAAPAEQAPLAGVTLVRLDARLARVSLVWLADPETASARAMLVGGYTSRLVQRLRVRDALVYHLEVGTDDDGAEMLVAPGDVAAVVTAVRDEVARLGAAGPDADELVAVHLRAQARLAAARETLAGRAWLEGRRLLSGAAPPFAGVQALPDPAIVITGPAPGVTPDRTWDPSAVWGPG